MPVQPILLADDDPNDAVFFQHQLSSARILNPLQVVTDGEQVVDYLAGYGEFSDRVRFPLPVLFFLDLRMPRIDGYKILTFLRANSGLHYLPTIVLSALNDIRFVNEAYLRGARTFLIKPLESGELVQAIRGISDLEFRREKDGLQIVLSDDAPVKPRFGHIVENILAEPKMHPRNCTTHPLTLIFASARHAVDSKWGIV